MIRAFGLSIVASASIGIANAVDITGNAQVVVLSTITASETASLSFGTIAAFGDGAVAGNTSTLTMPADGSGSSVALDAGTVADSNIVVIAEGNPGSFEVTGAAPNAVLTVAISGGGVDALTDPSSATDHTFDFTPSGIYYTTNGSGNTFTSDTDATGNMVFNVGGTLTTNDTGTTIAAAGDPYDDATYTGTYTVSISY